MKTILVIGASGFIGSHFVGLFQNENLILVDSFAHKGTYSRLEEVLQNKKIPVFRHDLNVEIDDFLLDKICDHAYNSIDIVNFASHSAVERSIENPGACWTNNCNLILNVLNLALKIRNRDKLGKILHVNTDEVFGDSVILHQEYDSHRPSNIYAASKSAQDALCCSYKRTYDLPIIETFCVNNYGFRQDPEKFIPLIIKKLKNEEPISIYLDKDENIGTRYYIHCYDHCLAIKFLLEKELDKNLFKYNICSNEEFDNEEVVKIIAKHMNIEPHLTYIKPSHRKGYDSCYKINDEKIRKLGWYPIYKFEESIQSIIDHSLQNPHWIGGRK